MHWQAKVAIQFTLSHLPGGEVLNHRLQWWNGNYSPEALRKKLLERIPSYQRIQRHVPLKGAKVVEVGTGWELLDPLLMFVFGAGRIHTYDHVRHLRFAVPQIILGQIQAITEPLVKAGADASRIRSLRDVSDLSSLLSLCNVEYVAPGDAANTGLPQRSIDLFFSYAVLEHVPPAVLNALVAESRRILKPVSGIGFHVIDPGDHYAPYGVSKVNFLRYSDRTWNFWVQNKISYHNRLRAKQFLEAFASQGAQFLNVELRTDAADLTLLRDGFPVDKRFAGYTREELAVSRCDVVHAFPQ